MVQPDKRVRIYNTRRRLRDSGMENLDEDQEVEYELVEKDGKTSAENLK